MGLDKLFKNNKISAYSDGYGLVTANLLLFVYCCILMENKTHFFFIFDQLIIHAEISTASF